MGISPGVVTAVPWTRELTQQTVTTLLEDTGIHDLADFTGISRRTLGRMAETGRASRATLEKLDNYLDDLIDEHNNYFGMYPRQDKGEGR